MIRCEDAWVKEIMNENNEVKNNAFLYNKNVK